MDLSLLNKALSEKACCKTCGNNLKVICKEHHESGLGKNLKLCWVSDNCKDNEFTNTEKDGQCFKIDRTSVLAFRTIDKKRSAAAKFLAVMNLGSPVSKPWWKNHTDVLLEIASEILRENMNVAGKEVYATASGELSSKDPISTDFSFDCSWNKRGRHRKEGVIAAISENTVKIIDVVHKTLSCPHCKKVQTKRANNELSRLDYKSWKVEHELNCMMNHTGSSSVRICIFYLLFFSI